MLEFLLHIISSNDSIRGISDKLLKLHENYIYVEKYSEHSSIGRLVLDDDVLVLYGHLKKQDEMQEILNKTFIGTCLHHLIERRMKIL